MVSEENEPLSFPKSLCTKACLITDNPRLAAEISSRFNSDQEYFVIIEAPRVMRPDGNSEVMRCNNAIARLNPKKIFLGALDDDCLKVLRKLFPEDMTVIVNTPSDLDRELRGMGERIPTEVIECTEAELIYGILLSKAHKKRLRLVASAKSLEQDYHAEFSSRSHLILIDTLEGMAPVITANLAFSSNAYVKIQIGPHKEHAREIGDDILKSKDTRDVNIRTSALEALDDFRIKSSFALDTSQYSFVTYVTLGVPYGYFFPEKPSAHLFAYPCLGLAVFSEVYFFLRQGVIKAAVIIDPGSFEDCETEELLKWLRFHAVPTLDLVGKSANVRTVESCVQFFPYDLLFVCSHGGEVNGERVCIKWKNPSGNEDEFVFDFILQIVPPSGAINNETKLKVEQHVRPISYGGKRLRDSNAEEGFLLKFLKTPANEWKVVSREERSVPGASAIFLKGGHCTFSFRTLASDGYPVVINNGCWTFHELGKNISYAGARAYIGTLFPIANGKAKDFALKLFRKARIQETLPVTIWRIQNEVYAQEADRPYIFVGCHFSRAPLPRLSLLDGVMGKIESLKRTYARSISSGDVSEDGREEFQQAVDFLSSINPTKLM